MYYRVFWINQASETFFSNSDKIAFLENLPYRFRNFTSKDSSFTFTWIYIYIYSIINCIKILRKFFKIVILVSKVSILSVFHFSKHTRGKVIVNRDTKFLFGTDSDVGPLHFLRLKFDSGFRGVQGWAKIAPLALLNSNGWRVGATVENTVVFGAHLTGDRAIKLIVGILGDLASAR